MIRTGLAMAAALAVGCGGGGTAARPPARGPAVAANATAAPLAAAPALPRVRVGTLWVVEHGASAETAGRQIQGTLLDANDLETLGQLSGRGFGSGGIGVGVIGGRGYGAPGTGTLGSHGRPHVRPGAITATAGLDRNIIRRVLRAYLPRVRFCYERRLLVNPGLAGRLDVAFVIDTNGAVSRARATGLDPSVARCVEQVFRVMRFPRPQGGGVINVRYPFIFTRSSGASIGTPFGPPSVPPAPQPHAVVKASDPLPEAPLPEPVIAATQAGQPLVSGCVALDHPDGLESITDAVEACYGQALQGRAGLIERLEVVAQVDDDGRIRDPAVSGKGALSTCVANAVQSAVLSGAGADQVRGQTIAFTLALDKDGGAPPPEQRVVATAHDLRLGLRSIASEVPWREVGTLQLQAWRQIRVETKGNNAPLVLRADDDLSSGVVLAALATLPGRGNGLRFARNRGDSDWKLVNPLGGATTPEVCGTIAPMRRVTVLVDGSGFWLATGRGYVRVPRTQGHWDLIGFARQLRTLRREELHDRSDLELAVTSAVPYEVFAKTLEIAVETGFFDATVKSLDKIANPRNRPPRR